MDGWKVEDGWIDRWMMDKWMEGGMTNDGRMDKLMETRWVSDKSCRGQMKKELMLTMGKR